ncbi:MAG TPA: NifU family protein [Candidatus Limnocylindrales bacterium]|nr:NifU family protein [Candidatus Limnocylindrales bacterium]
MNEWGIAVTDAAAAKIAAAAASARTPGACLRVAIVGQSGSGFRYDLGLADPADPPTGHIVIDAGPVSLLVEEATLERLRGSTVDVDATVFGGAITVVNPNEGWSDPLATRVQMVLDQQVNPGVASHGGFVELLEVREATAYIALGGGCQGCGMADVTLRQGIEVAIKAAVPEIVAIVDTTDHASGTNPYYQPSKK